MAIDPEVDRIVEGLLSRNDLMEKLKLATDNMPPEFSGDGSSRQEIEYEMVQNDIDQYIRINFPASTNTQRGVARVEISKRI